MKWRMGLLLAAAGMAWAKPVEKEVAHAGVKFRVVTVEPAELRLVWRDPANDRPFATFDRVQAHFAAQGKRAAFLMNAGIYEPGGIPSGLHIEEGRTLRPLNQAAGQGNFFLKPNGIFWIEGSGKAAVARVAEAGAYAKGAPANVAFATQSGPLLLAEGKRHPLFKEGSENRLLRNGVGVTKEGKVVLAITARGQGVNLWDFAGLFLQLGCRDALYLDGDISMMAVNPAPVAESNRFGAMFVIVE